jgi:hypothetical protein
MSSRIPGVARWYEGISPEKLDQEAAAILRVHQHSKKDRRAIIVFALRYSRQRHRYAHRASDARPARQVSSRRGALGLSRATRRN